MNIFDLSFVEVTKIINAKKLVFKTGARSSSKEWRNKYDGNEHGYYSLSFTIGGEAVTSYKADVDTDAAFTPDTEVVEDGVFMESKFRSAPYFDIDIDGITIK